MDADSGQNTNDNDFRREWKGDRKIKSQIKNDEAHKNFTEKVKEFIHSMDRVMDKDLANDDIDLDKENLNESDRENIKRLIENLQSEVEENKKLSADYLDKLKRNMAEFDNYRKRTAKERASLYDVGVMDLLEKLIPVVDSFELALNAAPNKDDNFYRGVEMILKMFQSVIFSFNAEEIQALGEKFDPTLHNAVAHVSNDAFSENEIIEVMRKGYKYKEKVLRHSMVKVAN